MHTTRSIPRTLVIFALVLAAATMVAQKKDEAMEQQVFYRTVKVNGLSIFYREAGRERSSHTSLLHGLPSSSRMFQPLLTRLADQYHLIAPDYPGFGHSDWPDPKQFDYTFDHIASVMNGFTEALGLSRYTLYMQDYGGPVGFRMALAHPERIEAHRSGCGGTQRRPWGELGNTAGILGGPAGPLKKHCAQTCCRLQPPRRAMLETTRRLNSMIRIFGPMNTLF